MRFLAATFVFFVQKLFDKKKIFQQFSSNPELTAGTHALFLCPPPGDDATATE